MGSEMCIRDSPDARAHHPTTRCHGTDCPREFSTRANRRNVEGRGSHQGPITRLCREPSRHSPVPFTTPGTARARSRPRSRSRPGTRRGAPRRGRGRRRWRTAWGWRRRRWRGPSWPWAWPWHSPSTTSVYESRRIATTDGPVGRRCPSTLRGAPHCWHHAYQYRHDGLQGWRRTRSLSHVLAVVHAQHSIKKAVTEPVPVTSHHGSTRTETTTTTGVGVHTQVAPETHLATRRRKHISLGPPSGHRRGQETTPIVAQSLYKDPLAHRP